MSDKNKKAVTLQDLTPEELLAKAIELETANGKLSEEKSELAKANAELAETVASHETNIEALAKTNEELVAKVEELVDTLANSTPSEGVKELEAKLEESEKLLTEALDKIDQLENRVKTGKVTVKHEEREYEVIPPTIGTRGFASEIGEAFIPSDELHKYPELIADYVSIQSGFLKLKTA